MNKGIVHSLIYAGFLSLVLTSEVYGQLGEIPVGARARGLGNTVVSVADIWSVFNNIAGIAELDKEAMVFSFDNRYQISAFNTVALGFVKPFTSSSIAVSAERFGNDILNNLRVSAGYAHRIGSVSIGLKASYLQYSVEGLGSRGVPTFEFGVITRLSKDFYLGAHVYNVHRAKLSDFENERVPTILKIGISYQPSDNLMVNIETEKDVDFDPVFRVGLEYKPLEKLSARIGVETENDLFFFGVGYVLRKFDIDYAFSVHQQLGLSHHLSVAFNIKTIKKEKFNK